MVDFTPVHAHRMLKLASKLDTVARKQFDMGTWFEKECDEHSCGTAACALGWAGRMPEFRRLGLKSYATVSGGFVRLIPVSARDASTADAFENERKERLGTRHKPLAEYTGYTAAEVFFGLSETEANKLFSSAEGHETPKQVAKNLRAFVKVRQPQVYKADRESRLATA